MRIPITFTPFSFQLLYLHHRVRSIYLAFWSYWHRKLSMLAAVSIETTPTRQEANNAIVVTRRPLRRFLLTGQPSPFTTNIIVFFCFPYLHFFNSLSLYSHDRRSNSNGMKKDSWGSSYSFLRKWLLDEHLVQILPTNNRISTVTDTTFKQPYQFWQYFENTETFSNFVCSFLFYSTLGFI